jgi:hypothetical protein
MKTKRRILGKKGVSKACRAKDPLVWAIASTPEVCFEDFRAVHFLHVNNKK